MLKFKQSTLTLFLITPNNNSPAPSTPKAGVKVTVVATIPTTSLLYMFGTLMFAILGIVISVILIVMIFVAFRLMVVMAIVVLAVLLVIIIFVVSGLCHTNRA